MIYISSSCVKALLIKDSIEKLYEYGFQNIEFSGGTRPYDEMESDILNFKNKYEYENNMRIFKVMLFYKKSCVLINKKH